MMGLCLFIPWLNPEIWHYGNSSMHIFVYLWMRSKHSYQNNGESQPWVDFINFFCALCPCTNQKDSSFHLGPTPMPNFLRSFLLTQKLGATLCALRPNLCNRPLYLSCPCTKKNYFFPKMKTRFSREKLFRLF